MICCRHVLLLLFASLPLAIPSYAGLQDTTEPEEESPANIPIDDIWRWFRLVNIFIKIATLIINIHIRLASLILKMYQTVTSFMIMIVDNDFQMTFK